MLEALPMLAPAAQPSGAVRGGVVLVTGAGGFIGGEVARLIAGEAGFRVRGATRDGRDLGRGIVPYRLDVRDAAGLASALQGVDAVVHCAVGERATTLEGTANLMRAARATGVRRLVHLSSVSVYGSAAGVLDEDTPLVMRRGRGYAEWKRAAEALCRDAGRAGLQIAMLRPAIVYGPNSRYWITLPARRVLSGNWPALGEAGRGTCNPVHVRDVAEASLAAIRTPRLNGCEAFNISGSETTSWHDWYERVRAALGCPPLPAISPAAWRRRSLGSLPFKAVMRAAPALRRLMARRLEVCPAQAELAMFALAATYPTDRAAERLGWRPRVRLAEGLQDAMAWLRANPPAP